MYVCMYLCKVLVYLTHGSVSFRLFSKGGGNDNRNEGGEGQCTNVHSSTITFVIFKGGQIAPTAPPERNPAWDVCTLL